MRILHVTTPAPFGGLERVVTHLAESQRTAGDEVHVATLTADPAATQFLERLARRGVTVHPGTAAPRDYLGQRRAIATLGARLRPDVVHTHGYRADVLAASACRKTGAAVVSTLHGFTGGDVKNRCYEWMQRRAVRMCDSVVAVSESIAGRLQQAGVPRDRMRVIPNSIPMGVTPFPRAQARGVLHLPADQWTIGWIGRVSNEKGLDVLLEAMARVGRRDVRLAVIGDGPERPALTARALALGLGLQVTWCGTVAGADRLLNAFDLFVLSSRTEGSPLVALEAMAAGTPILATTVGGVPEMLSPSTALLVPPEDPEALAEGIRRALSDRGALARRALRAHVRFATAFTPAGWVARYAEAYHHALSARAVPA